MARATLYIKFVGIQVKSLEKQNPIVCFVGFYVSAAIFSYIVMTSFSGVGSQSVRKEPPTLDK
jgi:hypothetical protein